MERCRSQFATCAALILIALMQTGCPPDAQKRQDNLRLIADAQGFYDKKQYVRAAETAGQVLTETPEGPEAAKALYIRGAAYALSEKRSLAYVDLRAAAKMAGEDDTRWKAHALLGVLYFEDENWNAAATGFSAAAAADPKNPQVDFQLYKQAQALERLGRWSDAQPLFTQIVYELPKGNYTDVALRRIQQKPTSFGVRCGLFDSSRNAEKLVTELRAQGFKPRTVTEQRGAKTVYVVVVGQFDTYREMKAELKRVKAAGVDAMEWP